MHDPSAPLSEFLQREVRDPAFFRVLTGGNAGAYIDILDALDRESAERPDGLDRAEAVEIVVTVLAGHPEWQPDQPADARQPDLMPAELSLRDRARRALDHLTRCRWLEEPPRKDWKRRLFFDAHGATLIAALRQIGRPEPAIFTDKLAAVCNLLADADELRKRPLQTVEVCLDNTRQGLSELRAMQKSVQRLTRRQLEEETLRGNLSVVFDDYAGQVARGAYAELVRARLPARLPEAVRRIGEGLLDDPGALPEMQAELLRREPNLAPEAALRRVRRLVDELAYLLGLVLPMADEVDRRTADFTRRSLARFRYLQDVTGERRGEIREFFTRINRLLSGRRLNAPWELPPLPDLRLPDAAVPGGLDSLYAPPLRRVAGEQASLDEDPTDEDREAGLRDMERALRDSLSVRRANDFVKRVRGRRGARVKSAKLPVASDEGLTDLIALLLHAESGEAAYSLESERIKQETSSPPLDKLPGCRVERFTLVKK
jgi:hypothetical protein